jgi:hypothetical protein
MFYKHVWSEMNIELSVTTPKRASILRKSILHCFQAVGREFHLPLLCRRDGLLKDEELRYFNEGRELGRVMGRVVVSVILRIDAQYGQEGDDHTVIDIALEAVVQESNTKL